MWNLSTHSEDWGKCFILTADINLNASADKLWSPIGSGLKGEVAFSGSFDGRNYTISSMYINTVEHWQGLFGCVTYGTILNLNVEGKIHASGNVGGIVGQDYVGSNAKNTTVGPVANCYSSGTITGTNVGSIVGSNGNNAKTGAVTNCQAIVFQSGAWQG